MGWSFVFDLNVFLLVDLMLRCLVETADECSQDSKSGLVLVIMMTYFIQCSAMQFPMKFIIASGGLTVKMSA